MLRRILALAAAPALTLLALAAWAVASPVGAGPDDDYHLVSAWCASAEGAEHCTDAAQRRSVMAPAGFVYAADCFAFEPEVSAGCQRELDFAPDDLVRTDRGNFYGAYPAGFYTAMGWLVGEDLQASVVLMRVANAAIFVGFATALFWLLPASRRPTLVWMWLLTTVPLGAFVIASTNPSSWAITGVGTSWLALVGWYESVGRRKAGLAVVFAASVLLATTARGEAAIFTVLGIVAAVILSFRRDRRFALESILPAAAIVFCIVMFRVSRPIGAITEGLQGDPERNPIALVALNILQTPLVWTGVFGNQWGLGWLDTTMPAVVWLATLGAFVGAVFMALRSMSKRKALVLIAGLIALWALPVAVLTAAGDEVGENLQPRYLVPLMVVFAGALLFATTRPRVELTRVQRWLIGVSLGAAFAIALQVNLQRYVHGTEAPQPVLDLNAQWWWDIPVGPTAVWAAGSLAFAGLLALLLARPGGATLVARTPA